MSDHITLLEHREGFVTLPPEMVEATREALGSIAKFALIPNPLPPTQAARIERFQLQSFARWLMPHERVNECLRSLVPLKQAVEVWGSPTVKAAHYKNLKVCASVWMCPVCAAKITERRREELQAALDRSGYKTIMLTYTFSHHRGNSLNSSVQVLTDAFRLMKGTYAWAKLSDRFGFVGSVKALEVTHGEDNGWHPHVHDLLFLPSETSERQCGWIRGKAAEQWQEALGRYGRRAHKGIGVQVSATDAEVGDYVAKWGVAAELTKQPMKRGKGVHLTPMQLLALASQGDDRAAGLWQEFARTFKGRHQLQWTKGLRDLLGLGVEQTDEQIALEERQDAVLLASLTWQQWRVIMGNDLRGELLNVASSCDPIALRKWLAEVGVDV